MRLSFEGIGKLPPVDQMLTADEFTEILVQKPKKLGRHGESSWVLLLGYCVSHNYDTFVIKESHIRVVCWNVL